MKKVINLKEMIIVLISVVLVVASTSVFATDAVFGNNNASYIPNNEYDNAQTPTTDNNTVGNNTSTNNASTNNVATNNAVGNNIARTYNTNNSSDLPQTGIEDYNIGILLIICVASAIYAYKKIKDYQNI